MKVIAECSSDEFLVRASKTELAHIMGHGYAGAKECPKIMIGLEVHISTIYDQYWKWHSSQDTLDKIREHIADIGEALDHIEPLIVQQTIEGG